MNKQEVIARLIEELNLILTRPSLFMLEGTVSAARIFLNGFGSAYSAVGITSELGLRRQATRSRGWESGPTGGVEPMREAGLTEKQIVQELLLIEIKMLELVAAGLEA